MSILVTGGAGFIGSHTCVELLNAGYDVVVADNLYNASEKSLERVKKITGKDLKFYKADIRDKEAMNEIFEKEEIESVIHFAGLKAVGESVAKPWEYYENNISGTLTLLDVMRKHDAKNIIFSSSATVYGDPAQIPITEECPKGQIRNPYDLEPEEEALIGRYFEEEYKADFVFVTHYPSKKRPFYAMDDPDDKNFTQSFDLLFKGLEVTTGGQRIHEYQMLLDKIEAKGMTTEGMEQYLDIFKHGMPPHGGLGIGLERLTMQLLGEDNVRETTLFPRDLSRLEP